MKVRWTEGSVRFRITPTELEQLRSGAAVRVTLRVPGGKWEATVAPSASDGASDLSADGEGGLRMTLGRPDLDRLCAPETEGVYFGTSEGEIPLRFFIEKDFPCVHPRPSEAQEESETFAPPSGFKDRHRPVCE
ncbi:MAG: hypothetical protein SFU56_11520 [Capsulimonadales bacterium]|nr:hypothetical protein [Capsulimonadales bacterium]